MPAGQPDAPRLEDIPGLTRGMPAPGTSTRAPAAAAGPYRLGAPDATASASGDGAPARDDVQKAIAYLLRSTQQRPQTEAELRAKLARREVEEDVVDAAIAEGKRLRAIDDRAFARAWVEDRGRKRGYGQSRLRSELRRRLVADDLVDDALTLLDERDDLAAASDLAAQRAATFPAALEPEAVARRLVGYLVRRGYPPGLAQRAAITASGLDRVWD